MLDIEYIEPQSAILSEHILYYYFIKTEKNKKYSFVHFPHYRCTLNIYKEARIKVNKKKRIIHYSENSPVIAIFNNNKTLSQQAHIHGKQDIVGIVFRSLGFNRFINTELYHLQPYFNEMNSVLGDNFIGLSTSIFKTNCHQEKAKLIDAFLLPLFRYNKQPIIQEVVNKIIITKGSISVQELEHKFSINRRTLLRLFKRHLCCSIMEFKRVIRFRMALDAYQKNSENMSLTDLSHDYDYYDQSDFINQFKSFTGHIPSKVLNQINQVGQKDMFWQFNT